ncbi:MAG: hypothetical protein KGZ72_02465 [Roseovarius sp.]|jgi:chromosome segregation ATPase|nr:hypothetical protein [Roseovarius sp.]
MTKITIAVLKKAKESLTPSFIKQWQFAFAHHCSCEVVISSADRVSDLSEALGDGHLILTFDFADVAVARGLTFGTAPSDALLRWIEETSSLLAIYRRNRRAFTLVPSDVVAANPSDAIEALAQKLDLNRVARSHIGQLRALPPPWSALHALVANEIVATNETASQLNEELVASALPLKRGFLCVNTAYTEICEMERALKSASSENCRLSQEKVDAQSLTLQLRNDLTNAQLKAASACDELVALNAEHTLVHSQLSRVQDELHSQVIEAARSTEELRESLRDEKKKKQLREAERTLLLDQLSQIQDELHSQEIRAACSFKELRVRLHASEETAQVLEGEIAALRNSTSWKVTSPLRGLKRLISGQ